MDCCGNNDYRLFSTNNEYGEKYEYDPDFKGPKSHRSPTDVFWLVAFLIFTTVWLTMGFCVLLHDPNHANQIHFDVKIKDLPASTSVVFEYLKKTLWCYLSTILIATIICLILIYVMRWVATPVVWLSIFLMVAVIFSTAITGFVIYFSNKTNNDDDYTESNSDSYTLKYNRVYGQYRQSKSNTDGSATAGLVLGICFSIITIIVMAVLYFSRQKIAVAIALIKEGSKAVSSSYSTVFFPIIPLIFQISIFAMWASVAVNIQFYGSRDDYGMQSALHILNCIGSLWAYWFIDAFEKMVFAHTFSSWYWTFDKRNLPFFTLTTAVVRTTRFHLGTVALGSILILIGQIICHIIRSIMKNRYLRVFNLCCNIANYIERFLKFLNKNTYIMVAIHGNPFCKSMRDAFNLLMRNIVNVYVTNRVTTLQFAIFTIAIASGMGGLTYLFLPKHELQSDLIVYPILVSVVGSSIVAATFFGVYSMAIDTLFLCFLEDCERNDGTEQRPYYMSQTLMRVLHKNSESLLPPRYEQLPPSHAQF